MIPTRLLELGVDCAQDSMHGHDWREVSETPRVTELAVRPMLSSHDFCSYLCSNPVNLGSDCIGLR